MAVLEALREDDITDPNPMITLMGWIGTGKSTWAMSAQDAIWFSFEPGSYTAAWRNKHCKAWLQKHGRDTYPEGRVFQPENLQDFEDTWRERVYKPSLAAAKGEGEYPCRVVFWDTITELSEMAVDKYIDSMPMIQAYGKLASFFRRLFREAREANIILCPIAHWKDMDARPSIVKKDDKGNKIVTADREHNHFIVPDVEGKTKWAIMRKSSAIFNIEREGEGSNAKYRLISQSVGDMKLKNRFDFAGVEVDLDFQKFLSKAGYLRDLKEASKNDVKASIKAGKVVKK